MAISVDEVTENIKKMEEHRNPIKDSGEKKTFESGAWRDMSIGKGRMDLIPPEALLRLSVHYANGAEKYGDNNWQLGIPLSSYLDSAIRHIMKFSMGQDSEDHLSAAVWNLMAIMYHQHREQEELNNLPNWQGKKTQWIYKKGLD